MNNFIKYKNKLLTVSCENVILSMWLDYVK